MENMYYIHSVKVIKITYQEIKMATRPNIYRNKKRYTRKCKHKNKYE